MVISSIQSGVAAAALALVVAGTGTISGVATATVSPSASSTALVTATESKPATVSATRKVLRSGEIRIRVNSNARKARIKFRDSNFRQHFRKKRLRRSVAKFRIPAGSNRVKARGMATKRLRRSRWVRARLVKPTPKPTPTQNPLVETRSLRVFFGHQSVGRNILGAVPGVYRSQSLTAPRIVTAPASATISGGFLSEKNIGQNRYPHRKLSDFDSTIRGQVGKRIDVAFLKFCYVDVTSSTDTTALFNEYVSTMSALEKAYPNVVFMHTTVPLTISGDADNAARQRYNQKVRAKYQPTGRLFDLAKLESTKPNGERVSGTHSGPRFYELYRGYASDSKGHLNSVGAKRAATALMYGIADAH